MDRFSRIALTHGVPLRPTNDLNLIPDGGWANSDHLNWPGARVFSRWLGAATCNGTLTIASHQLMRPGSSAAAPGFRAAG